MLNVNFWMHFTTFKFKIFVQCCCMPSIQSDAVDMWNSKPKNLDAFRMTLEMSIRKKKNKGEGERGKKDDEENQKRRDGERIEG